MQKTGKVIFLVLLLGVLWIPFLQGLFHVFKTEIRLQGAYVVPEKPKFVLDSFLTGAFQKKWEAYEDYNFGFRPVFVKLKNSFEYFAFKQINASDIIEGKNGFLYSYGSVERNLWGRWYNGKEKNENTLRGIKHFKEKLEKKGVHFLAIIVPAKESIVPENLPESYTNAIYKERDYDDYIRGYKRDNIPFIDLCAYLQAVRDTCPYPLFTKTGFHWSIYGASIAQDTILKFIQSYFPKPMPQYRRTGIEWSDTARGSDADFEEPMNLLYSLQDSKYVYPKIEMVQASLNNYRPKVIIIGDSFFWQIKGLRTIYNIFSKDSKYWYYYKQSFPISDASGCQIKDIDVIQELESADVVILLGSMSIGEFPYGVTDYYYANGEKLDILKSLDDYIRKDPEWMKKILNESNSLKDSPEKGIRENIERIINAKQNIQLMANNNKYVCADGGRGDIIVADRDRASSWETFSLVLLPDQKCVIYSYTNKFFSAELGLHTEITATRDGFSDWEIFTMIKVNSNQVAFKAANGKYLSVDEKTSQLFANGDSVGANEKFVITIK